MLRKLIQRLKRDELDKELDIRVWAVQARFEIFLLAIAGKIPIESLPSIPDRVTPKEIVNLLRDIEGLAVQAGPWGEGLRKLAEELRALLIRQ